MKVLVCGGRDYDDLGNVWSQLDAIHGVNGPVALVIHGGAKGADRLAAQWAHFNSVQAQSFLADWTKHGRAAEPIRNKRMLEEGRPDLVLAFPGGQGTADMVKQAQAAGVEVVCP